MRILLDTNVVVSALIWGGVPARFIAMATAGEIELVTSSELIGELHEVLGRPHLASRVANNPDVAEAILRYAALAIHATPLEVPRVVHADPDDDHVLAAAVAGAADILVSGDRRVLEIGTRGRVAILSPSAALERIALSKPSP